MQPTIIPTAGQRELDLRRSKDTSDSFKEIMFFK